MSEIHLCVPEDNLIHGNPFGGFAILEYRELAHTGHRHHDVVDTDAEPLPGPGSLHIIPEHSDTKSLKDKTKDIDMAMALPKTKNIGSADGVETVEAHAVDKELITPCLKKESCGPKKAPSKVGEEKEALAESLKRVPVPHNAESGDRTAEIGEPDTSAGLLSCDTKSMVLTIAELIAIVSTLDHRKIVLNHHNNAVNTICDDPVVAHGESLNFETDKNKKTDSHRRSNDVCYIKRGGKSRRSTEKTTLGTGLDVNGDGKTSVVTVM